MPVQLPPKPAPRVVSSGGPAAGGSAAGGSAVGNANANVGDAVNVNANNVGNAKNTVVNAPVPSAASAATAAAQAALPYGRLAALGAFKGFVSTPVGEVHVEVIPGKSKAGPSGARPPVVYLDGLDACGRAVPTDETVVRIDLIGQLRTLARDVKKHGSASVQKDIDPNDQVTAVIGALDALGVDKPVHIMGLSYGGMIAALTKKAHPDRVDSLVLCSPYVHSTACGDPVRDSVYAFMTQNPWNPMGAIMYRAAARAALVGGVVTTPPELAFHAPIYGEAMVRLSMGLEGLRLSDVVKGLDNVHILSAMNDVMSPHWSAQAAQKSAQSGSFSLAPPHLAMQHDLVRMAPSLVRTFIESALSTSTSTALEQT